MEERTLALQDSLSKQSKNHQITQWCNYKGFKRSSRKKKKRSSRWNNSVYDKNGIKINEESNDFSKMILKSFIQLNIYVILDLGRYTNYTKEKMLKQKTSFNVLNLNISEL